MGSLLQSRFLGGCLFIKGFAFPGEDYEVTSQVHGAENQAAQKNPAVPKP